MQERKTYNGFTNYETWAVSLWMENDQHSYDYFRELAKRICSSATVVTAHLTKAEIEAVALAEAVRNVFEANSPVCGDSSVYADLMSAALSEVDWHRLAVKLLDELQEDVSNG